jgi:hypothetical protein
MRPLAGLAAAALATATLTAQYSMTVNRDRLANAQNEPQNWLMMNGDYSSTRYSKLTQLNRDNVKDLRMVWALALGGMQDVGQNGPENEVNPLIDNGFMYTTDGWGTVYKIDARNPNKGEFVWINDFANLITKCRKGRSMSAWLLSRSYVEPFAENPRNVSVAEQGRIDESEIARFGKDLRRALKTNGCACRFKSLACSKDIVQNFKEPLAFYSGTLPGSFFPASCCC